MRVIEIATRYETSVAFVCKALARLGFNAQSEESWVPAPTLDAFERAFGEKIRTARPVTPAADAAPGRRYRQFRPPAPHIIRVGYEKVTGRRNPVNGQKEKALYDPPGIAHAIDAAGTWEGDPWKGHRSPTVRPASSEPHFYDRGSPRAACGTPLRGIVLDEFTAETADACPRCTEIVAAGHAFRTAPHEYVAPDCRSVVRLNVEGRQRVLRCFLERGHIGLHEDAEFRWNWEGTATRIRAS